MTREFELSVVMATYNRAETVSDTLRHLAEQDLDHARYEVIVIDDGSPDDTRRVVKDFQQTAPFALTYLHHSNQGPGFTQNRGIEQAKAPVVLLMADDILMSPRALSEHLAAHLANPDLSVAVLGRVEQSPKLNQSVFLRTWDPFRFSDMAGSVELPYYRFWACNISAKRDFLLRYGPFRSARGRGGAAAHEDPELGYRLSRAGLRILYCPRALGHHYHIVSFEGACRRAYEQGLNFGDFRAQVGQPEIAVAYHVIDWTTISDHFRAWFGARRQLLARADRNPLLLLGRYAVRDLVFSGFAVRRFWTPMLERAEHDPGIARRMRPAYYRGVIAHHFFRGFRMGKTWAPATPAQTQQA